ncbi:MAG: hypothetical protein OEY28_14720, partial [Nitrospira sp.]|nr:hypothetical protein [Nitrospira sp.]
LSEEVYVIQMRGGASPLPSTAVNVTGIGGFGAIRHIELSRDGAVMACIKSNDAYPEGYRSGGTIQGKMYVVGDVNGAIAANATSPTLRADFINQLNDRFSRGMAWLDRPDRYTLYYGLGTSSAGSSHPQADLRLFKFDLDRLTGNTLGPVDEVLVGGQSLPGGALYIYGVGEAR